MTNTSTSTMQSGYAAKKKAVNTLVYVILAIMVIIWIAPIVWLVLASFSGDGASTGIIPKSFTLDNYIRLFVEHDPNTGEVIPMSEMRFS